ncbi:hypothetical protein VOLCADRAFT_91495 [Volvox carteri f. nagariensis]|uniref:Glycosyltransferase n=1 Tax=Volvox carteri f. nagariensis TaxID=3068 RepID=D8TX80_VOLCA|nr:uncharacterized protein VOLCADRAFT_91495 [Volvox carteri f. nagariensis]EFJ47863.1 hypothetical protein VOLCADRAFT_91495 [Volvox carteri f. nagariensis]|eukprot:XP_002950969.1 hypothetical protein VOLCADRAFT_91495 [Volvox carteri f. nagariensis]
MKLEEIEASSIDAFGGRREVVLMTIASEFAFERLFDVFLHSLYNITFTRPDGPMGQMKSVDRSQGSFTKTSTILDGLTLGVDVLFLDADQVFFRNPLPYILAREADILVSGDCHNHGDATPMERFPPINNNIGFVYFRPTAMVTRAIYNWALWLRNIALTGNKPWDQSTFAPAVEWVSSDVSVRHLSMSMLHPDLFPYYCMGPCGCDLRRVPYFHNGRLPRRPVGGDCEADLVREWYNYHVPCGGDMNEKANRMQDYADMYVRVVGPINSRSAPMTVLV